MIALKIALVVFLLLLFTPRKSYPWVIAAIVPTYVWLWWIINRPLPISDDWGELGRAVIFIALIFGMLPALVRFLIDVRGADMAPLPELDWRPAQASCMFVAIWGAAWLLTPALTLFAGAAACIAVALVLSLAMFGASWRILQHRILLATAGVALITGAIAILMWPMAVVAAAERRASGRPYCLVVAHGSEYRTARSLLDLTPIVMRGREGGKSALNFHGELLLAREDRRNWSYEHFDFIDKASDHTPPQCVTKAGFARNLPWI